MEAREPSTHITEISYTDGESVSRLESVGPPGVEGVLGAIGAAMIETSRSALEQADSNEEYQSLLMQIKDCSVFRRKQRRALEQQAAQLHIQLLGQAMIDSFGAFEPMEITQREREEEL